MRRFIPLFMLGVFFVLVGGGLLALTLRKPKAPPAMPNKTQLREQAKLQGESNKLRLAAAILGGLGIILMLIS
jgi:hypothetical protein